jgi:hypothetical protein
MLHDDKWASSKSTVQEDKINQRHFPNLTVFRIVIIFIISFFLFVLFK